MALGDAGREETRRVEEEGYIKIAGDKPVSPTQW